MKYMDVIANAIMLQNVVDLTDVLHEMRSEGFEITAEQLRSLSPYMRENILRFGKRSINMDEMPDPLRPKPLSVAA